MYIFIAVKFCHPFFRNNPTLREMDLVHAKDYANMSFNQLRNQLQSNREKDQVIQKVVP